MEPHNNIHNFLYRRRRYRGQVKPEALVFNANLQDFAQRISYITDLETAGKISPQEAYQTPEKTHLAQAVSSTEGIKAGSVKSSAMTLVIKHLLVEPHSCASLVQKIGKYSASHISYCLTKLKKAGLIGAEWHCRKVCLVYYNIKLEEADSKGVARPGRRQ